MFSKHWHRILKKNTICLIFQVDLSIECVSHELWRTLPEGQQHRVRLRRAHRGMWDAPQVNDLQLHAAFPKAAHVVNAYQNSARLFKLPQFPSDL